MTVVAGGGRIEPGGVLMPGSARPAHHPYANIFPMLAEHRRESFRANLATGQNHPITLHRGMILDGRNRERELVELGKPVAYNLFVGTLRQALDYVIAENLERRDLTDKVRAGIAAHIATLQLGDNQHTRRAPGPALPLAAPEPVPDGTPSPPPTDETVAAEAPSANLSLGEAATLMQVPLRTARRAAAIERTGAPELKDAVYKGGLSLAAGADIAQLPVEEQKKILAAADPKAVREIAKSNRAERQKASRERRLDNMRKPDATPLLTGLRPAAVLYADVPRKFQQWSSETGAEKSPENHYRVETFEFLVGLREQILKLAQPNCAMFMYGWAASLLDQIDLLAEWGFASLRRRGDDGRLLRGPDGGILPPVGEGRYRTHAIWAKKNADGSYHRGTGFWFIDCHEVLMLGARGDVPAPLQGTQSMSIIDALIGENSEKPDAIRDLIDRYFPGVPKTELFARPLDRARWPNWEFWGNEFADLSEPQREAAE